jgi:hypothetical protein
MRRSVLLGAVASLCVILLPASAGATIVATKLPYALSPIGGPNETAVDQAAGNVYVADHATNTVKIFGAEGGSPTIGVPSEVAGTETPSGTFNFLSSEEPAGVAVDGSGNLYVADAGHEAVDKFKLEGGAYKYVCQFTGFGNVGDGCLPNLAMHETNPAESFRGPGGIAIDTHGNVYVSTFGGVVDEFNSADEDVRQATIPTGEPSGLAVDSSGVVYVQDYQGPVYELTPNASEEFVVAEFDESPARAVAVDPATNDVYVDHDTYIVIRESAEGTEAGKILGELRFGGGFSSEGVAVNGANQVLYAANSATKSIEAFELTTVPDVKLAGPATEVGPTSARVHGEIDPNGTKEASYYFEYGRTTLNSTSPAPPGTSAGEGMSFVPATAELTGLLPGVIYHYRLVGTNSSGITDESEEGTFRTSEVAPEVANVEATEVTADSVVLRASVNPENQSTQYHFEYGESETYGQSSPEIGIGEEGTPVAVAQALPAMHRPNSPSLLELKPDRVYHYRLVAVSSGGTTRSVDHTFQTLPTTSLVIVPPVASTGIAITVSQTEATVSGSIRTQGLPTSYVFELGAAENSYETSDFGSLAGEVAESGPVASFTNLRPGTTYHYRLVASNAAGTSAGPDRTFTTALPAPSIAIPSAPLMVPIPVFPQVHYGPAPKKCKKGFVKKGARCVHKRPKPKKRRH